MRKNDRYIYMIAYDDRYESLQDCLNNKYRPKKYRKVLYLGYPTEFNFKVSSLKENNKLEAKCLLFTIIPTYVNNENL